VPHEYEARFRIQGVSQIAPTPRYHGDLRHLLHGGVLSAHPEREVSPLFGWRQIQQPESALEIEDRCTPPITTIANSVIQVLEYADHHPTIWEPHETLNALKHPRPSRFKWRSPLFGLLGAVLPFMICAWGTAYKLSLYKAETNSAPAKVCTRGSDAAKSSVIQALDGRKVFGKSITPPLPVNFPIASPVRDEIVQSETCRVILPLQSCPMLMARAPPIRFLFS
jgi:hypothetical protein